MDPQNKYTVMQQHQYDDEANAWKLDNKDPVVGSFDQHNSWLDYDTFLFKGIDTSSKVALDFGCGPGRNIVKFANRFYKIDGVDISNKNLENAKLWCEFNHIEPPNLFKTNGVDLSIISNASYDVIFSTICLQHICVHEIRFHLMKEFHRVLKADGFICLQMGYGYGHPFCVGYHENHYDANRTNSGFDTRVNSPVELQTDLEKIGFRNFDYDLRPTGPGDSHSAWIFFRAQK
jgi:ubiquinone/menaquinone biosynthesis C-methylase UbiE